MFTKIFLLGLDENTSHPKVRKRVLLNILLLMSIFYLSVFSLYNLFVLEAYSLATIDVIALLVLVYAYIDVIQSKKIEKASVIVSVSIFFLLIFVVYFAQAKNFSLIWTMFLPVFIIFLNGSKKGLVITTIFYLIIFTMAFSEIGVWDNGAWSLASFLRFVSANISLTIITYFFEKSFEIAHKELSHNREIEEEYIEALEHASITDPLTQLYNRRYLDYIFDIKFNKAKIHNSYFSLFILDLDYFKDYNDTYGHIAGDEALKKIADVLKIAMRRESDSAFRLGGEEFCGLLMANEHEKIVNSIENIRKKIEELHITHIKSPYKKLTASFGVCTIHSFDKKDLDAMYKIADDMLYEAKRAGRNSIKGQDKISLH
ncbi:diguanylate cyclase [Sulfurimonas sp.]